MHVNAIIAGQGGLVANVAASLQAAAATLSAPTDPANVASQLKAYQGLANRWAAAGRAEREMLTPALTGSAFAQRIQTTLNAFTRAAWAGPDAPPPAPQIQMLKAFDQLSETDQRIVAAMQPGDTGAPSFASPSRYRKRLQDAALKVQVDETPLRGPADTISLSAAAQAQLAGAPSTASSIQQQPGAPAVNPDVAAALASYARAAG
jgi:hypothetical protein